MSLFVSIHRAPGMSREEFQQNAPDVLESKHAKMRHVFVNVFEGFIVTVYEGDDKESVQKEFERLGFPFEEINEVQINMSREQLQSMVEAHS